VVAEVHWDARLEEGNFGVAMVHKYKILGAEVVVWVNNQPQHDWQRAKEHIYSPDRYIPWEEN
jgi:hypothetical protein